MQGSLQEAERHVSELEVTRSRLEGQVATAMQEVKEVLLGESLVCFVSGDGPALVQLCSEGSSVCRASEGWRSGGQVSPCLKPKGFKVGRVLRLCSV